ncbi:MAG: hypothetical protein M1819_003757 [Sarea resinae]|nr:MAG: hypothetical protein M1819_003757 [Sarea resinae]
MLERYAKQNVDLQVRTKRRARKRKQAEDQPNRNVSIEGYDINEADQDDEIEGTQEHDVQEAVQLSKERKFDFNRFASKFVTQKSVDTFVAFTSFYNDLKPEQLKRAHRFFYRTAFKLSTSVLLFRVDIMALFNKMIKGPNGLDSSHPGFREWDELIRQLIKKLTKKLDQRPELFVEMLFSKISSTLYYLEYGYEKQTLKTPRIPAELEVKPGMELKEQIGIAVSVLLDQNKNDSLNWLKNVLTTAADERQSWEAEAAARQIESQNLSEGAVEAPDQPAQVASSSVPSIAVKPDNEERRIAMFKDNKMRLLMTLVGLMRLGSDEDTDAAWIVPSSLNSTEIRESLESIKTAEFSPPAFEDGKTAEDFIRRKTESKSTTTGAFGDEDEGLSGNEEDFLFPAGGPTARKADALNDLKKRRRRRNKDDDDDDDDEEEEEEVDEEVADARREARRMAEEEKRRKIKSALYVHDSDDEEDEERDKVFFAREEEGRKQHASRVRDVLLHGTTDKTKAKTKAKAKGRKRKNVDPMVGREEKRVRKMIIDESDSGAEDMDSTASGSEGPALSSDALRDEDDTTDTPISSPRQSPDMEGVENTGLAATKALEVDMAAESDEHGEDGDEDEDEDEDEDTPVLSMPRRKARAGLVVESDSE